MSVRPRIIIADDHRLVAEACKEMLAPEYDVVATVGDGRALLRATAILKPDLVIIDINMPLLNGIEAGQRIKRTLQSVKLVYLTINKDPDLAAEAFRTGASAYLLKTCAASELRLAIQEVLKGQSYLSPTIAKGTVAFLLNQPATSEEEGHLTARQLDVLQLLAEGKSMKEVGSVLHLTTRTVAFHKYRMRKILHVHSDADLVRYALRKKLLFT